MRLEDYYMVMEELIKKEKKVAIEINEGDHRERKWLEATPLDSYGDPEYRVRFFILEGLPPRAYVIASYYHSRVEVYDSSFRHIASLSLTI